MLVSGIMSRVASEINDYLDQLPGRQLIQFCVGNGLRLDLSDRPHYEITIETPLHVGDPAPSDPIEPTSVAMLAAVQSLLMTTLASVDVAEGVLTLRFDQGPLITVKPDDSFEAWQLRSDAGLLIVCSPGGELAVWSPE
jgi:hypothetical protein